MSAISFHTSEALLKAMKRLWFTRDQPPAGPRKGMRIPPQVRTPVHRHSAFFELP